MRKCEQSISPNLEKIVTRLHEILLFDCRTPHPANDPTYQNHRRFFQLLREYWALSRQIMLTALNVPVSHQPHALTRFILNLRSRLDSCFQHLSAIEGMQSANENVNTLMDILLSGDPDEFTIAPEWTTGLIQQIEVVIEKAGSWLDRPVLN